MRDRIHLLSNRFSPANFYFYLATKHAKKRCQLIGIVSYIEIKIFPFSVQGIRKELSKSLRPVRKGDKTRGRCVLERVPDSFDREDEIELGGIRNGYPRRANPFRVGDTWTNLAIDLGAGTEANSCFAALSERGRSLPSPASRSK